MHTTKLLNKQFLIGIIIGAFVSILIGATTYRFVNTSAWLPTEEIESKTSEFVNTVLLQGKGTATVKVAGKEGDLYELEVGYNGQNIKSFVSRDGKMFFPEALEMLKKDLTTANAGESQAGTEPAVEPIAAKSDKPAVELFVMSHCPYGLQMEKGIIPAIETLGDKIDFTVKFTDYAMHGEKELKEQMNQYCIQKEQPAKFIPYLECFMKDGDTGAEACISQSGIDKGGLEGCVAKTDKEYKVLENFNNEVGFKGSYPGFEIFKSDNQKYGVAGSPTLVINGTQSQSGRDGKSLLKSICSAFNTPPQECLAELSGDTPAPGFGAGSAPAGSSDTGGCH